MTTAAARDPRRATAPPRVAAVIDDDLPGFGAAMRAASLARGAKGDPVAAGGGVRGRCLTVTLPGSPGAIATCRNAVLAARAEALVDRAAAGGSRCGAGNQPVEG